MIIKGLNVLNVYKYFKLYSNISRCSHVNFSLATAHPYQHCQPFIRSLYYPRVCHFHSQHIPPQQKKPFYKKISSELKLAAGIGVAIAAYFAIDEYMNLDKSSIKNSAVEQRHGESLILKEKPKTQKIARSIHNQKDSSGLKLTLYQFQTCPFCCKLRAFLDYHGFSYDVVEVNSVTRAETRWSKYRKVPFLLMELPGTEDGDSTVLQLKDSSVIISMMSSLLRNPSESLANILDAYPSCYNEDNKLIFSNGYRVMYGENKKVLDHIEEIEQEVHWRRWVDEVFVHTLSPNVYRTPSEALDAFRWFSEVGEWERVFPTWERLLVVYLGAAAMWIIGKRLKKRHHLDDNPRVSLFKEAQKFTKAVSSNGGQFLGGAHPNLADLSVYGVLTAIEGCLAFEELAQQNKQLRSWYTKMKARVAAREGEQALVQRCVVR